MIRLGYIGWINRGNIGDEAIYKVFYDQITSRYKDLEIVAAQELSPDMPFDIIVLGGGDVLSPWNYGWDVEYNHFLSKGAKGIILGSGTRNFYDIESVSNFNVNNYKLLKSNLDKSEFIFVRDEVTKAYISSLTDRNIHCIGDIALLSERGEMPLNMTLKTTPGRTVAVNVADTYNECFGGSDEKIAKKIIETCVQLILSGYDVKLFSLYALDNVVMKKMAMEIHTATDKEVDSISHDYFTPAQWVTFFSKCSFVISERLHGCILAAAANTPFISLAYRWKCINFCLLYGVPYLAVKTDNLMNIDVAIDYIRNNANEISKQITDKKIIYEKRINKAFDKIGAVIQSVRDQNKRLQNGIIDDEPINEESEDELNNSNETEEPK